MLIEGSWVTSDLWWFVGCVTAESLWMGEITCSTVKEQVMSRLVCWGTAVGQNSRGLAWNCKEMLEVQLEHVWKDREVWSSLQWWRGMFRWVEKSYLSCVLNSVFADTAPTSRWTQNKHPSCWYAFTDSVALHVKQLSIAQLVHCRENKGASRGYEVSQFSFQKIHAENAIIFTMSSLNKGCIILYE